MKRILLIEDDDTLREILVEALQDEGFDVWEADNGLTGFSLAQKIMLDLIICDVDMPGMNGFKVLDRLRQKPATSAIPFIFISGNSYLARDYANNQPNQANACLLKPFSFRELLVLVKCQFQDPVPEEKLVHM